MTRLLSSKKKQEWLPMLIYRDGGFMCIYCKKNLDPQNFVFDHLNSNRTDNRIENLVLACQSCNIKKINDFDLQILAQDKLKENESKNFVGEKVWSEIGTITPASTEIEINTSNYDITVQFLTEQINTDGSISFSDALNSCAYLCKTKTGHGSQQAIRNYIALLTSLVGPFEIIKDQSKKKIIVKRCGQ